MDDGIAHAVCGFGERERLPDSRTHREAPFQSISVEPMGEDDLMAILE